MQCSTVQCSAVLCPGAPLAVIAGLGGRLRHVEGLLERPLQVDGPLLDHLPNVLDPLLLGLDAGRLRMRSQERYRK